MGERPRGKNVGQAWPCERPHAVEASGHRALCPGKSVLSHQEHLRGIDAWMFAGSHEITELPHATWTSYLVSARTVEVPFFTPAETCLLLTEPLKYSSLWLTVARQRPSFAAEFWGEGGIERIHIGAGGWPPLVQLIAETTVDLMNNEGARQLDETLLEQVLDRAIIRGHNVLGHQRMA
jgi:hypothetical protein